MSLVKFATTTRPVALGLFALLSICLVESARPQIAGPQLHLAAFVFDAGGGSAANGEIELKASSIGESIAGRSTSGNTILISGFAGVFQAILGDADEDGLNGALEAALGTKPYLADTDGDGVSDFDEVNRDGNPANYTIGVDTDPLKRDTDGDGIDDGDDPEPLLPQMQIPFIPAAGLLILALLVLVARRLSLAERRSLLRSSGGKI